MYIAVLERTQFGLRKKEYKIKSRMSKEQTPSTCTVKQKMVSFIFIIYFMVAFTTGLVQFNKSGLHFKHINTSNLLSMKFVWLLETWQLKQFQTLNSTLKSVVFGEFTSSVFFHIIDIARPQQPWRLEVHLDKTLNLQCMDQFILYHVLGGMGHVTENETSCNLLDDFNTNVLIEKSSCALFKAFKPLTDMYDLSQLNVILQEFVTKLLLT